MVQAYGEGLVDKMEEIELSGKWVTPGIVRALSAFQFQILKAHLLHQTLTFYSTRSIFTPISVWMQPLAFGVQRTPTLSNLQSCHIFDPWTGLTPMIWHKR